MTYKRFNDIFNQVTFVGSVITAMIVSVWVIWLIVDKFIN